MRCNVPDLSHLEEVDFSYVPEVTMEEYQLFLEDAMLARVTPPRLERGGTVPGKRFQRGQIIIRGKHNPAYFGKFREDRVAADGTTQRVQRKQFLGFCAEVSERTARKKLQPFLDAVNNSVVPAPRGGKTLANAVQLWRAQIAVNLKPSTKRAAESHFNHHILPRLGRRRLQELDLSTMQSFVNSLGKDRKTIINIRQTLFAVLRVARKNGYAIPQVVATDLKLPPKGPHKEQRFFTAEESARIIDGASEPYRTMFELVAKTELRAGELLGLKRSDFDFDRHILHVRRSIDSRTRQEQSTKPGRAEDIPLPEKLTANLVEFLGKYHRENPADYLFVNRKRNLYALNKVYEYGLRPILKKLGIKPGGLHAFRHGGGSEMIDEGVPITVVQRQLRHRDARTTLQHYGHVIGEAHRSAVQILENKIESYRSNQLVPGTSNGAKSSNK